MSIFSDFEFSNSDFNKDNFSVIHFNARSFKKSFTKIEDYLLDLNCSFDVIMISETWFGVNIDIDSFKLNGYTVFYRIHAPARTPKNPDGCVYSGIIRSKSINVGRLRGIPELTVSFLMRADRAFMHTQLTEIQVQLLMRGIKRKTPCAKNV